MAQITNEHHFSLTPFVCNGKGIGLTYSNVAQQLEREATTNGLVTVNSTREALLFHLRMLEPHPVKVMVSQETHQDGSHHYHAMCQWLGAPVRVGPRHFDWNGIHPNIQQLNRPQAWDNYLRKEDEEPLEWVLTIALDDDDLGYLTPPEE